MVKLLLLTVVIIIAEPQAQAGSIKPHPLNPSSYWCTQIRLSTQLGETRESILELVDKDPFHKGDFTIWNATLLKNRKIKKAKDLRASLQLNKINISENILGRLASGQTLTGVLSANDSDHSGLSDAGTISERVLYFHACDCETLNERTLEKCLESGPLKR